MSRSQTHFEEFAPHSRHKHLILRAYLESWGRKMLLRPQAGSTIVYVDACAGRGSDDAGHQGSPVIAAIAASIAETQITNMLSRPVKVRVVAIEKRRRVFEALSKHLAPFGERVSTLRGTLEDHVDGIADAYPGAPTLYFIDPFGLEPLRADTVRRALSGPKNEAFLLFADQAALRHFGAASAAESKVTAELRLRDAAPGLFDEIDEVERIELAAKAGRSEQALEVTRTRAIEILDAAFGNRAWLDAVGAAPAHARRQTFLTLYKKFLRDCGATHVLPIPILSETGAHVYYLIHATRSRHGYRAMKESIEYALKRSPLPEEVVGALRSHLHFPAPLVAARVRDYFRGQIVRWAESNDDRTAPCIRNFVLDETPVFPSELNAVKGELQSYRRPGPVWWYGFPP